MKLFRGHPEEPLLLDGEEWRPIPGHPLYQASNLGRIKVLAHVAGRFNPRWGKDNSVHVREKIRRPWVTKGRVFRSGELVGNLDDKPSCLTLPIKNEAGITVTRYVHHLVLEAFMGLRPQGTEACHWDGDATNNRLANLRWDTSKGNKADSIRLGTFWPKLRGRKGS